MAQLDNFDLNFCVRRIPKKLLDLMKSPSWHNKIYIGGGFIRGIVANEPLNDIDLFIQNETDAGLIAGLLADNKNDLFKTQNAITIRAKLPVQIITRWLFAQPQDVAQSFDFTICCAVIYFDGEKWQSYCDDRFYTDLAAKRLVYRTPQRNEDGGGSMLRVLKYYQRGYRIPLDSLGAVIARLVKAIDPEKIEAAEKDPEKQTAKVITGLLREVDPNIDINHVSHLPSLFQQ